MQFYNMITDRTIMSQPWQEELKAGDYYIIESPLIGVQFPGLVDIQSTLNVSIYGQILDARNCEPGFFNVIAYSVMCPNGEEGELCIMDVTRTIDRDEFETARRESWTV